MSVLTEALLLYTMKLSIEDIYILPSSMSSSISQGKGGFLSMTGPELLMKNSKKVEDTVIFHTHTNTHTQGGEALLIIDNRVAADP